MHSRNRDRSRSRNRQLTRRTQNLTRRTRNLVPRNSLPRTNIRIIPSGTASVTRPLAISPLEWADHVTAVNSLPIFLISCHGEICTSYAARGKGRTARGDFPTCDLSQGTYVLNATSGGEVCSVHANTPLILKDQVPLLLKMLLIDDKTSIPCLNKRNVDFTACVSGYMRATNITDYPNIMCTFKERDEVAASPTSDMGVFDLDTTIDFKSPNSILDIRSPKAGPHKSHTWFLDEIIQEVYAKQGIQSGVFVFMGCTSQGAPYRLDSMIATESAMDEAIWRIRNADLLFNRLTLTKSYEELEKEGIEPHNLRTAPGSAYINGMFLASMARALDEEPTTLFPTNGARSSSNKRYLEELREEVNIATKILKQPSPTHP